MNESGRVYRNKLQKLNGFLSSPLISCPLVTSYLSKIIKKEIDFDTKYKLPHIACNIKILLLTIYLILFCHRWRRDVELARQQCPWTHSAKPSGFQLFSLSWLQVRRSIRAVSVLVCANFLFATVRFAVEVNLRTFQISWFWTRNSK